MCYIYIYIYIYIYQNFEHKISELKTIPLGIQKSNSKLSREQKIDKNVTRKRVSN